jgi:hypothetical protein
MRKYLTKLILSLDKGEETEAEAIKERIAESIEEAINEEIFFLLPTNEIVKIIKKSDISDAEAYSKIISRMCEVKGVETALVLSVVELKEATFEECVQIVSSLKSSPICVRLGDLYAENEMMPERDYEHEILKLEQEIEELKKQRRTIFKPVTQRPSDFEDDIHKAAGKGKLTSVQYLIEQCQIDVEAKDKKGWTPLHCASGKGHIKIVEYLIE